MSLQDRVLGAWPTLSQKTSKRVLSDLLKQLRSAYENDLLSTGPNDIHQWVRLDGDEITGGILDFRREPASARLVRDDGAWIHFRVRLRPEGEAVALHEYHFEIVFPDGHTPPWVRLDLNPPDAPNADRELRSHMHPGNDDLLLPSPVMTPEEILDHFLRELRPRDPDKPRA